MDSSDTVVAKLKSLILTIFSTMESTVSLFTSSSGSQTPSQIIVSSEKFIQKFKNIQDNKKGALLFEWFPGNNLISLILPYLSPCFTLLAQCRASLSLSPIEPKTVHTLFSEWLKDVIAQVKTAARSLLCDVHSGDQLSEMREALLQEIIKIECEFALRDGHRLLWNQVFFLFLS